MNKPVPVPFRQTSAFQDGKRQPVSTVRFNEKLFTSEWVIISPWSHVAFLLKLLLHLFSTLQRRCLAFIIRFLE
jgi:hypothetical protein